MAESLVLIDEPVERVRRVTLNRPEKRTALSASLRRAVLDAVHDHDRDPAVSVTIIRGAGICFSAGYDLNQDPGDPGPGHPAGGGVGSFMREVTEGWMSMWELAKPVIAQVHGYCLAGGSELARAATSSTPPTMTRSGIPPCGSVRRTCSITHGCSG